MPVNLTELDSQLQDANLVSVNKLYSPKFFSKKLTGKGGNSTGQLTFRNNPPAIPQARRTDRPYRAIYTLNTNTVNRTTTYSIPILPIEPDVEEILQTCKIPDINDMRKIGENNLGKPIYAYMEVSGYTIEETIHDVSMTMGRTTETKFIPAFLMRFFTIFDSNDPNAERCTYGTHNKNMFYSFQSNNPIYDWNNRWKNRLLSGTLDDVAFMKYMEEFEIFDSTVHQSEQWQEHMDTVMSEVMDGIKHSKKSATEQLRMAKKQVRYIMTYNIPLEKYRTIYQDIKRIFSADEAKTICKENLNLLLSDTLHHLDANKGQLLTFAQPDPAIPLPAHLQKLSKEQAAAVQSNEPLILVQAGAGTGKSTLILGRIDYLIMCGVKPEDITVLSFTNAAADHIKEKNPNIHSMTIARMIHEIYSANFPDHELSSLDTLLNSVEIYYPTDVKNPMSIPSRFCSYIRSMLKNETNNFTDMNNFIEEHYDDIIGILDTIRQTSLELEIIICYQKIDTFVEPPTIQSKFLIIDEVQDNSIFEFVYTLKYIDKHKESMFIVGRL